MKWRPASLALPLAAATLAAPRGRADDALPTLTDSNVITGSLVIDFATRTHLGTGGDLKKGSPELGVSDRYQLSLNVAKTTEYTGDIVRLPRLYSPTRSRTQQDGRLTYNLNIAALNPKDLSQKKKVGKWFGDVPLGTVAATYDLSGGAANASPLRVTVDAIGKAQSFTDPFAGKLIGRTGKKQGLSDQTYMRVVRGNAVKIDVKRAGPIDFQAVELAKGPVDLYPRTTVNGRLDLDYETKNYLTDGITFTYSLDGKAYTDKITGSIRWIADPDYKTNGKGSYEFNLRFNDAATKPAQAAGVAAQPHSNEAAYFAVDRAIPCLAGTIESADTFVPGTATVASSAQTYKLSANKLTKQQIVNIFKLWVVAIGPMNDE